MRRWITSSRTNGRATRAHLLHRRLVLVAPCRGEREPIERMTRAARAARSDSRATPVCQSTSVPKTSKKSAFIVGHPREGGDPVSKRTSQSFRGSSHSADAPASSSSSRLPYPHSAPIEAIAVRPCARDILRAVADHDRLRRIERFAFENVRDQRFLVRPRSVQLASVDRGEMRRHREVLEDADRSTRWASKSRRSPLLRGADSSASISGIPGYTAVSNIPPDS